MEQTTKKPAEIIDLPGTKREGKVHNFELTFNLSKAAQGRFLTDFPQSATPTELAAGIAMLNRQARILQAGYDLEQLEEELDAREGEQAQHRENRQKAETSYVKERATLTERIASLERQLAEIDTNARQAHQRSDKRGEYKPYNQIKQKLASTERLISEARNARAKLKAERRQANDTVDVTVAGNDKAIGKLKAKMARKRVIAAGGE